MASMIFIPENVYKALMCAVLLDTDVTVIGTNIQAAVEEITQT